MVCAFTANRDLPGAEQAAEPPDRFDIAAAERRSARGGARELTFGAGVHYCVGANLARAELVEALSFLARRVRDLELDGEPVFESATGIYGMERLPIRFSL